MVETVPIQVLILYASETGTGEQISLNIATDLKKHYATQCHTLASIQRAELNQFKQAGMDAKDGLKLCIIVASSTGEGDSPENGEKFYRYLRKESCQENKSLLSHVFYTVLGLGDSTYAKFQGNPRFIDSKLKQLGAHSFYYRAEADEN
jgi:sulfite reductase alpha subunit-like flavoprotein